MKLQNTVWSAVALSAVSRALLIPRVDETDVVEADNGAADNTGLLGWMRSEWKERKQEDGGDVSPLFRTQEERTIPNRFIVVLKDGLSAEEAQFHTQMVSAAHEESVRNLGKDSAFFTATSRSGGQLGVTAASEKGGIEGHFDLGEKLRGYVGYFTDDLVDLLRRNPQVEFIEQDAMVYASDFNTQNNAPWGLARVSHREKLTSGSSSKYLYDDDGGAGVTAYVIDTGINIDHVDFQDRAHWGKTIPSGDADYDGNGHGTHCAGTIASKTYGVAKNANVVAVKVLGSNGSGSISDVIRGVEYAVSSHRDAVKKGNKNFKGSVANMSLGGGRSQALNMAVDAAVDSGLHFAVAAGNENQNACNTSPAGSEKAVTVGASTLADDRAYFSNWGTCVDIFAPGMNILSTYVGSDTAVATLSGTSMASPHVAGLLGYFLSLQPGSDSGYQAGKTVSPAILKKKLIDYGTKGALSGLPAKTVNILAFNGAGGDLTKFWDGTSAATEKEAEVNEDDNIIQGLEKFVASVGDHSRGIKNLLGLNII